MFTHISFPLICLLSILIVGCARDSNSNINDDDSIIVEDSVEYLTDDTIGALAKDSTMIGEIFLGMNKKDFNRAKTEFLKENTSLSNLKIAKLQGFFYKDKLVRITIISDSHLNWYHGREELYRCSKWTDLYNRKYSNYNVSDIHPEVPGATIFDKGQCLIVVTDDERINDMPTTWDNDVFMGIEDINSNPLRLKRMHKIEEEAKTNSNSYVGRSGRYSKKRYSRIDIVDKNLFISTENKSSNERSKSKEERSKKELDLIYSI